MSSFALQMWLIGGVLYLVAAWVGRPPWVGAWAKDRPASQLAFAAFIWIGASLLAWPVFLAARVLLVLRRKRKP